MAAEASAAGVFVGIDFGTSGARATAIDEDGAIVEEVREKYAEGRERTAEAWVEALSALLSGLSVRDRARSIAIDATSSTAMLVEAGSLAPLAPPAMYDDARASAMPLVEAIAPEGHTVRAPTSTLCKLAAWVEEGVLEAAERPRLTHQADLLAQVLTSVSGVTDYNNALKLGYDPDPESGGGWPSWLEDVPEYAATLPRRVVAPGEPIAPVSAASAARFGLPESCLVCGGTTDSIAAFLASEASTTGDAVTSLGSTLVLKLLSETRVDDARRGVYSHRLGTRWLVGGASNTGGAVLRQLFSDEQLRRLSGRIDPAVPSALDYYPLPKPGERFPVVDPDLQPRLTPRPENDAAFLHGLLESMARIERDAFEQLAGLGASELRAVRTAGGGAANAQWLRIRERVIGVPVTASSQTEASYGAALLARTGALTGAGIE